MTHQTLNSCSTSHWNNVAFCIVAKLRIQLYLAATIIFSLTVFQIVRLMKQINIQWPPRSITGVCPVLCSGNGIYVRGECQCYAGWKGKECATPEGNCENPTCSGNGKCVSGECICSPGWTGPECNQGRSVWQCCIFVNMLALCYTLYPMQSVGIVIALEKVAVMLQRNAFLAIVKTIMLGVGIYIWWHVEKHSFTEKRYFWKKRPILVISVNVAYETACDCGFSPRCSHMFMLMY